MPPVDIPISSKLFTNVRESALTRAAAAMENAYVAENGGIMRFAPLRVFATLPAQAGARVYLNDWRGSLVAVSGRGRFFTVTREGLVRDVTGVPLSGNGRPTFAKTDDELLTAAGGPILKYSGTTTAKLSDDAPSTTHVGYVDGYTLAIEPRSGRFYHSSPGRSATWEPLDVFTAEGKPDDLNALFVSDYRELLLTGEESVEQFERLPNGDRPFFRRWASGESVLAPYTITGVDQGVWFINKKREFVRLSGQTGQPRADDVQRDLSKIVDWSGAWASDLFIDGQKFIVLQIPNEPNAYGTAGITLLLDIRSGRWSQLYGWDLEVGLPVRWPGWSVRSLWGRVFVGGDGVIYELTPDDWNGPIVPQRMLWRSGHIEARALAGTPKARINDVLLRVTRGENDHYDDRRKFSLRVRKDNSGWSRWIEKDFGAPGEREMQVRYGGFGEAAAMQFEVAVTDATPCQVVTMQADITPLAR